MKNDTRAILTLITTYTIGNFLLLLNRGIYWDGWVWILIVKERNYALLWELFNESKRFTAYYIFRISGLFDDPILFLKFVAFFSWLLAILFLYGFLRKKLSLRVDRAFFISAFYALTPTFLVRTESSILYHPINLMIFFLATFIYSVAEKNKNKFVAILNYSLSWILFFLSFHTYSLLVLYGGFLLLLLIFYRQRNTGRPFVSLLWPWFKNNFFFIILPIIFWSLKLLIWRPESTLIDYDNFISLNGGALMTLIQNIWQNTVYGFFWPIVAPLTILQRKIFAMIALIIFIPLYLLTKKVFSSDNTNVDLSPKKYVLWGLFLFVLGMIPYLAVGKVPHIFGNGFSMRHALLLPLGSSLIILGVIIATIKDRWQTFVQVFLLMLFSTFTIYNYYGLDMDWYKQQAIIENLKTTDNENIKNATTLIFHDKVSANWQNRNIRGEEYLGYVQNAFPKDNLKFALTSDVAKLLNPIEIYQYFLEVVSDLFPPDFDPAEKIVNVDIVSKATSEILTVHNWLTIKKSEFFSDQSTFIENIKNIYQIKVVPSQ